MLSKASSKELLRGLFAKQPLAVLGTHTAGQPYGNLVAFAATRDLTTLLFATARDTRKFANISADSRISLVVDDRKNRPADFRGAVAVTATGRAKEVRGQERSRLLKIYLRKHPHLKEFVTAPGCALLRIRVEAYYVVSRFQNVTRLAMR